MKNENLNEPNFNLTNDVLFKDYYSNPDNLSVLLSLILGIKILPNEIIYENNEIISLAKGKKTRFDLRISLVNNYDIDLEMQNKNEIAFKDRAIYYMSSLIMSNLKSGGDYRTNKYYIGIWLLNTPSQVYKDLKYMKVYTISDENNEELIENKYRIIFIDLKKLEYCDNIEIKEYLSMIKSNDNIKRNLYSNNIFIKEAAVNMNNYTELSKTIDLALEELRQRLDYNTSRNEAKEEGIEEGIQKNQKEVALNLYQMGMEIELIAKAVNLSVDEVNKILNM